MGGAVQSFDVLAIYRVLNDCRGSRVVPRLSSSETLPEPAFFFSSAYTVPAVTRHRTPFLAALVFSFKVLPRLRINTVLAQSAAYQLCLNCPRETSIPRAVTYLLTPQKLPGDHVFAARVRL